MFCIRMGDNISHENGAGNFTYNLSTGQFDVNIISDDSWSDIEKISHELKHANQYLNRKLSFRITIGGRVVVDNYSRDDELEAFNRQGQFGRTLTPEMVHRKYSKLPFYGHNEQLIPTDEQTSHNRAFNIHLGYPEYLYYGWNKGTTK